MVDIMRLVMKSRGIHVVGIHVHPLMKYLGVDRELAICYLLHLEHADTKGYRVPMVSLSTLCHDAARDV